MSDTTRTRQLRQLASNLPNANQNVAQGLQAARQAQLQDTIKKARPGIQATGAAQQLGTQQAAQGAQNATNYSFQFAGVTFIHDPSLTAKAAAIDATYVKGFWLAVPANTIGALTWIPKQNRQGVKTTVNLYGTISNPYDGQVYAIHSYEQRADGSTSNGYTQDVTTEFEISLDVALESAPLSTSTASTIFAFAMV